MTAPPPSPSPSSRERLLGAAGVVMILAVVVGVVWFFVAGRTDSAVPAPQANRAVPATPSPVPQTPGDESPTDESPTPPTAESPSASPTETRERPDSEDSADSEDGTDPEDSTDPEDNAPDDDTGSTFTKPLTQKGLPTDDDLAASGLDWSSEASYDGPGEAPSLCLGQDLTTLDGLQQIFRRDYTLDQEGYGTALVFDFDDVAAAESVADALVKDAAGCRTPLTKAGFLAEKPGGPTDVAIPEGIWGRTVDVTYRQGEEQPVTREGIGVARAGNRVLFLSLVVQIGEDDGDSEGGDTRQDLGEALTRAAERLTK